MSVQLSLFGYDRPPTWGDVQKGSARSVLGKAYSRPCTEDCLHSGSIFESGGEKTCYLFRKPIKAGMCPGTVKIEWR